MTDAKTGKASRFSRYVVRLGRNLLVALLVVVAGFLLAERCGSPAPIAAVDCAPLEGASPVRVTCINDSQHFRPHAVKWDYGDGREVLKSETRLVVWYDEPGPRTVELTVSGTSNATDAKVIQVLPPAGELRSPLILTIVALTKDETIVERRAERIGQRKSDHPSWGSEHQAHYSLVFEPSVGARITGHSWSVESDNEASGISFEIKDDGRLGEFAFQLKSGPRYDRWDGWLYGELVIEETRTVPGRRLTLATGLRVAHIGLVPLGRAIGVEALGAWEVHTLADDIVLKAGVEDSILLGAVSLSLESRAGEVFLRVERGSTSDR